jgi:hypothetical protein
MQEQKQPKSKTLQFVKGLCSFLFLLILGWAVFLKPSAEISVYIIMFGVLIGLVWLLLWQPVNSLLIKISKGLHSKIPYLISLILIIIIMLIIRFTPIWGILIDYATPLPTNVVYQNTENNFIKYHPLTFEDEEYPHGLLVEFGVNFHDEDLDASLSLNSDYKIINEYWDKPKLLKPSSDAVSLNGAVIINNLGSYVSIGKALIKTHDVTPPNYLIQTQTVMLTPSRSYYLIIKSQDILEVKTARLGDITFIPNGDELIPK